MTIFSLIISSVFIWCIYILYKSTRNSLKRDIDFLCAFFESESKINDNQLTRIIDGFNTTAHTPENKKKLTYINERGYRCFKNSNIPIHRWLMKKHLNRKLNPREVVHHIDGNKLNNMISNLMLFPNQKEHNRYHCDHLMKYGTWAEEEPEYNCL